MHTNTYNSNRQWNEEKNEACVSTEKEKRNKNTNVKNNGEA